MVEGARLESECGFTPTAGSNPVSSALVLWRVWVYAHRRFESCLLREYKLAPVQGAYFVRGGETEYFRTLCLDSNAGSMPHGAERVRQLRRVPWRLLFCEVTKQNSLATIRTNPVSSALVLWRAWVYPRREGLESCLLREYKLAPVGAILFASPHKSDLWGLECVTLRVGQLF